MGTADHFRTQEGLYERGNKQAASVWGKLVERLRFQARTDPRTDPRKDHFALWQDGDHEGVLMYRALAFRISSIPVSARCSKYL